MTEFFKRGKKMILSMSVNGLSMISRLTRQWHNIIKKDMTKRYLNIKQVSEYTSLPVKTLYEWGRIGKIPSIKIGRKLLFDITDIDRVMESLKRNSLNEDKTIDNIIADVSHTKYNILDSSHTGTIEYEKGGE